MKRSSSEMAGANSNGAINFRKGETHTFVLMFDTLIMWWLLNYPEDKVANTLFTCLRACLKELNPENF